MNYYINELNISVYESKIIVKLEVFSVIATFKKDETNFL